MIMTGCILIYMLRKYICNCDVFCKKINRGENCFHGVIYSLTSIYSRGKSKPLTIQSLEMFVSVACDYRFLRFFKKEICITIFVFHGEGVWSFAFISYPIFLYSRNVHLLIWSSHVDDFFKTLFI